MQLTPNCDYIEAYLTLRCNFKCEYCINDFDKVIRKRNELSGSEWIKALNRIETKLPITLGGGEPTLHRDFYEIVNGIKTTSVDLLTNLSFDVDEFIANTTPSLFTSRSEKSYKPIRVSYHQSQHDPHKLVAKARKLSEAGYNLGILGIFNPYTMSLNNKMAEICKDNGVFFFCKEFLGELNGIMYGTYRYPKALSGSSDRCMCRTNELLIGPDGNINRCHKFLYDNVSSGKNITNENLVIDNKFDVCNCFGQCNPCDVKFKLNHELVLCKSSVEIESIPQN